MSKEIETTQLLPFLPYLLQDLWELGSNPADMIYLIKKHIPILGKTQILDLACGKGAAAVKIAQSLNVRIKGIDLIPEFIEYATCKAKEFHVDSLCNFVTGDINSAVFEEKNYDCVILGSAGDVLGSPAETFDKLKLTINPKGYILFYDVYLTDITQKESIQYKDRKYLTYGQWLDIFSQSGLKPAEAVTNAKASDNDSNNNAIINRAHELTRLHPDKKRIFEDFVNIQLSGSHDLKNCVAGVTWLLHDR